MAKGFQLSNRCGIILAGGEGKRLQPLVRRLHGKPLPKQYVNFVGSRSMLEHTFLRAEMLIPPERLFTVISQHHLGYSEALRQVVSRPRGTVIVQPENKETGPGLLLPLIYLCERFPQSSVAVFPSDHFVLEEGHFMAYVDLAFRAVERQPSSLVLLGIKPHEPEPEYGYILPGVQLRSLGVQRVLHFIEKPRPKEAADLIARGGLWNIAVMVFNSENLLSFVRSVAPALHLRFARIRQAIGSPDEAEVVKDVYRDMEVVNFSRGLLEMFSLMHPSRLFVVPVQGVLWSDWGSEARIISLIRKLKLVRDRHRTRENCQTTLEQGKGYSLRKNAV